ncbi:MAG: hypothetical protein JXQ90_09800 [Cyclobacteriaceae bacterium]
MKLLQIISFSLLFFLFGCVRNNKTVTISIQGIDQSELAHALNLLDQRDINNPIQHTPEAGDADLVVELIKSDIQNDGYTISNNNEKLKLSSSHRRGLIYGLMYLNEQLQEGLTLSQVANKEVLAQYDFRAIKFNLPWMSYRSGEHLKLHDETCRDLDFWTSFLDMMVENKINTLSLWSLHPFQYMVQPTNFPKASPFTDEEFAEWQTFWKSLFGMAKERGIDTYIFNWNIFVSEEFGKAYGMADYSKPSGFWGEGETNELIEQYTREIVTQTINEYEDLTGIGITLGERMGGMTSEERRDWIDRTMIAGLKNADREVRLFYRAPLSAGTSSHGTVSVSTEQLTREAIENIGLSNDVWLGFKFNWSHGHSSPKLSIVHGGILTDTYWDPKPTNYRGVYTVRNEDFIALRWAQPDFIRQFINHNSQDFMGGVIIGSETYIPAKDYITQPQKQQWKYAFERQWLFYKVWGNLLFDKNTPDEYFAKALANKFDLEEGNQLLEAWKQASMNANRFASFYQGTWDATLYTEGFTRERGQFIDINQLIKRPVLDSSYVNIANFVAGNFSDDQITPLQLAETLETESRSAMSIAETIRNANTEKPELNIELNDIEAWSHHGLYFAAKLRGAVALAQFRQEQAPDKQSEAVEHLTKALAHWKNLTETMERHNLPVIPYQFDPDFSWRKHIEDAERDVEIAQQNIN